MKWIVRALIVIVLLALFVFAAHWAYVYLLPKWAAISFYGYIALGLILVSTGIITLFSKVAQSKSFIDSLLGSYEKAKSHYSLFATARNIGTIASTNLEALLVWPLGIVTGLTPRIRKEIDLPRRFLATVSLQSTEYQSALFATSFILAAYSLGFAGVRGGGYGKLFVLIMIMSVVLRHIRYSIRVPGLPVILRRVSGSPYLVFLTIILADFLSLVLGFALLKNGKAPPDVRLQDIVSTIQGLYRGQELSNLLYGRHLSLIEIAIGSAGLLFYLALLQIVLHFGDFRRKDEDYLWLTAQHNSLGNFTTALKYINQVNSRTPEIETAQIISLLGVNQIEKARQRASMLSEEQRIGEPIPLFLLEICSFAPIPEMVTLSMFRQAITDKVPDVRLMDSATTVMVAYPAIVSQLDAILAPHRTDYPLTYAQLLLLHNQFAAALDTIKAASPGTEVEEIVRIVQLLRISIANPETTPDEDAQAFREWADSELPVVRDLLSRLATPWEKLLAYGQLNLLLLLAENLGKESEQEISFLLGELKAQIKQDPKLELALRAMEIRFQDLRKTKG